MITRTIALLTENQKPDCPKIPTIAKEVKCALHIVEQSD